MNNSQYQFEQRLNRMGFARASLADGDWTALQVEGLAGGKTRIENRTWRAKTIAFLFVTFFVIKSIMMVCVGEATYRDRVEQLSLGNPIERAGAVFMQVDPISDFVAIKLRLLLF